MLACESLFDIIRRQAESFMALACHNLLDWAVARRLLNQKGEENAKNENTQVRSETL